MSKSNKKTAMGLLHTLATWPITDPAVNMDAVNMRIVAGRAVSLLQGKPKHGRKIRKIAS